LVLRLMKTGAKNIALPRHHLPPPNKKRTAEIANPPNIKYISGNIPFLIIVVASFVSSLPSVNTIIGSNQRQVQK